jgi:hypothetical protein
VINNNWMAATEQQADWRPWLGRRRRRAYTHHDVYMHRKLHKGRHFEHWQTPCSMDVDVWSTSGEYLTSVNWAICTCFSGVAEYMVPDASNSLQTQNIALCFHFQVALSLCRCSLALSVGRATDTSLGWCNERRWGETSNLGNACAIYLNKGSASVTNGWLRCWEVGALVVGVGEMQTLIMYYWVNTYSLRFQLLSILGFLDTFLLLCI